MGTSKTHGRASARRNPRGSGRIVGALRFAFGAVLALVLGFGSSVLPVVSGPANALSGSEFNPGLIISDTLFYDSQAMTAAEIQAFLDAKIGACENGRCLNVTTITSPSYPSWTSPSTGQMACDAITGGTMRAAEWIYRVQVACGISAKVILVTLQKEQGLIQGPIARSPSDWSLKHAMGMACPDTAPCDTAFAGLATQIYSGTEQLKVYKAARFARQPGWHSIRLSVNADCGSRDVYIENYATAALYNYTPYQPNEAALANLYGTGDGCSQYGNRNFWVFYNSWFGSSVALTPDGVTVTRIGGEDRFEVAAGMSAAYFSEGASTVYVASGEVFPDAISAGAAAAHDGGPVLLVRHDSIPPAVEAELRRLAPDRIVLVGGPGTVSDGVLEQLAGIAASVNRVGGEDRYEVSQTLALEAFGAGSSVAYLATGSVFPDALSSGAAAGSLNAPVILIDGQLDRLDDATWQVLQTLGVKSVYIAGGPASVSDGILSDLNTRLGDGAAVRFGGSDRTAVSAAVNVNAFDSATVFFVASALVFPDALSATPAAAKLGAPLYVTRTECLDRRMIQHMIDAGSTELVIVGGPASVSDEASRFRNC